MYAPGRQTTWCPKRDHLDQCIVWLKKTGPPSVVEDGVCRLKAEGPRGRKTKATGSNKIESVDLSAGLGRWTLKGKACPIIQVLLGCWVVGVGAPKAGGLGRFHIETSCISRLNLQIRGRGSEGDYTIERLGTRSIETCKFQPIHCVLVETDRLGTSPLGPQPTEHRTQNSTPNNACKSSTIDISHHSSRLTSWLPSNLPSPLRFDHRK